MSHTPTPWHFAGRKGGWDGVTAEDGTDICALEYNNPANAAFIVRAVNAHDALVTALTETLGWIKNWDPPFVEDDEWPETRARIDAALALARQP